VKKNGVQRYKCYACNIVAIVCDGRKGLLQSFEGALGLWYEK